ncbi:hypothetical protein JKP88DRAFT_240836 [Tribonema minus]|uniref:Uncharacterized protein n=1 Tax=Tribonema minus TaxID=303371 RepID=A0A836CJY4_9STRA|nr:hypothetical protein JKP88DRAFT_240836 [Tribonema minus]
MSSNKYPYKCSAYRLEYISDVPAAAELVLQAARGVPSTKAVVPGPSASVYINMTNRSCRAHYKEIAAALRQQQLGDTITLVQPEASSIIAGQNEIRRLFPPAAAQLSLELPQPSLAFRWMRTCFSNGYQRLQQFVASQQQRLPQQWGGYIVQINYHPLLFQKRLPDNSIHDVAYVKTTSSGTDFIFSEHRLTDLRHRKEEGWSVAEVEDARNPSWQLFPRADTQTICARIRTAALLCNVVDAAAVVMATRSRASVPSFFLFVHLGGGCKPTRDGLKSFLSTMGRMSSSFGVQHFHTSLPRASTGYRMTLPRDYSGNVYTDRWTIVTNNAGVRTLWPVVSDIELPGHVVQGGFGLNNSAMLSHIMEAAATHVAHAITHGGEQDVRQIVSTLASGAPQQALATMQHIYTQHGTDVLQKVLDRRAREAAEEDTQRLRASVEAAEATAADMQDVQSRWLTRLEDMRAEHLEESRSLREDEQHLRQEVAALKVARDALANERYELWAEVTSKCRARGIFVGKYSRESDAMFAMAEHNDNVRGRLHDLRVENHRLRAMYDDALDHRERLQERMPRARR